MQRKLSLTREVLVAKDGIQEPLKIQLSLGEAAGTPGNITGSVSVTLNDAVYQRTVEGEDGIEVLKNCLIAVSSDLYFKAMKGYEILPWKQLPNGGLPSFPGLRLIATSPLESNSEGENDEAKIKLLSSCLSEVTLDDMEFPGELEVDYDAAQAPGRGDVIFMEKVDGKQYMSQLWLVISANRFNAFGWCVCLPITSGNGRGRAHGFAVPIAMSETSQSAILCRRPMSICWSDTNCKVVFGTDRSVVDQCLEKVSAFL